MSVVYHKTDKNEQVTLEYPVVSEYMEWNVCRWFFVIFDLNLKFYLSRMIHNTH